MLFESNGSVRSYILNRPKKLNALDITMLGLLKPKIKVGNIAPGFTLHAEIILEGVEPVFALWFGRRERRWACILCWR